VTTPTNGWTREIEVSLRGAGVYDLDIKFRGREVYVFASIRTTLGNPPNPNILTLEVVKPTLSSAMKTAFERIKRFRESENKKEGN
jgi:hypothetical protein